MYNLLHKEQLHVSALLIGHLQVDKRETLVSSYTRLVWFVVVVLYVIHYTYLYHHIVVLDRYTNANLVYYKHNGDDEPYDQKP